MAEIHCRHFSGYKPCHKNDNCNKACPHRDIPQISLLIVHLGALGAVLRSTSLLRAIKRKYPSSRITWVTDAPAHQLLKHNPLIDKVYTTNDLLALKARRFDIAFVIDKSEKASGVLASTDADFVYGFQVNPETGAIVPATPAASELWKIGLSDHTKFFVNKKTETQLVHEALELGPYQRDPYELCLTGEELLQAQEKRKLWGEADQKKLLIGLNTGCSPQGIPYKKLSVTFQRQMIKAINQEGLGQVVLLGGPEDEARNQEIAQGLNVISSPTGLGIRDGLTSVAACDLVVSGDSLGMHMAIALKKWVIAWFGPTCAHEIDLYDRGIKVLSQAGCGPCWKRLCHNSPMCYDLVSLDEILKGIREYQSAKNPSHSNRIYR